MKEIRVLAVLLAGLVAAGCGKKVVDKSKLVERGGLVYELNSEVPFTGVAVKFNEDGTKQVETKYIDGVEDRSTVWYWNRQTAVDYEYWDGKMKGKQMYWYENGQRMMEAELRNGQIEGRVMFWYKGGQKESEIEYHAGVEVSRIEWDTNGNLIQPPKPQSPDNAEENVDQALQTRISGLIDALTIQPSEERTAEDLGLSLSGTTLSFATRSLSPEAQIHWRRINAQTQLIAIGIPAIPALMAKINGVYASTSSESETGWLAYRTLLAMGPSIIPYLEKSSYADAEIVGQLIRELRRQQRDGNLIQQPQPQPSPSPIT